MKTIKIMKKLFVETIIIIVFTIANPGNLNGQADSLKGKLYSIEHTMFDGKNEIREIPLSLDESLSSVNVLIFSIIGSGELSVEIFDPNGTRYGNFSLWCQNNPELLKKVTGHKITNREIDEFDGKAMGSLCKTVKNPVKGLWIAKIKSKGAIGSLQITLEDPIIIERERFLKN
jgi:hypothetical protein